MIAFPRWLLACVSGLFGIGMIVIAPSMDAAAPYLFGFAAFCLLTAIACVAPRRISQFAGSLVGVIVFALAGLYLLAALDVGPLRGSEPPSPIDASLFAALFGLPGLAFAWKARFGLQPSAELPADAGVVHCDSAGVRYHAPDGATKEIAWEQLAEVRILTTPDGPWADDVFWMLTDADRSQGLLVSNSAKGVAELLAAMQALPGFDNAKFVEAMGSTSLAEFTVWRRESQPPTQ